ncbi:MAG TPA: hypothetical protein ENN99_12095, partial [Chloroflexi bacterium]|nr:hypothetical protein [Chloroflexota bacterium]
MAASEFRIRDLLVIPSGGRNMRRKYTFVALSVIVTLVCVSISATLASPTNLPLLQATTEVEPNDNFSEANNVTIPVSVSGTINPPEDVDFFVMDTDIGREYEATLTIWDNDGLRLRMILYNTDQEYIKASSSSASSTNMSWTANQHQNYIRIEAASVTTKTASYRLDVNRVAATPTATATSPPGADPYEPNDTKDTAYVFPVSISASATDANFVPSDTDQDWFAFYVKSGRRYRASTSNLVGVDTYLEVFNESSNRVAEDNDSGGGFASRVEWNATYDGYYYIRVTNMVDFSTPTDTYDLTISEISVSATATSAPAAADPNADRCDRTGLGNYDFDHACVISPNVSEVFNFIPPPYGGVDNDFYKIWVKPGLLYQCRTSDLSPGVDPNMIVYDHNRNLIGGNDDVEPGNFNSFFAYYATYEGWMYLLVGYGDRTPPNLSNSNYTLRCSVETPGQATATSAPADESPTATSRPGETATPRPTGTPAP